MAYLAVWSGAMAAMMLPSELPRLRLHHATSGSAARTFVVGAGYVTVWLAVGFAAMKLPWQIPLWWALGAAALYQFTPVKRHCLSVCRAPLSRVMHGPGGAFRVGVENGVWCLGCCIGFTVVLVALGMTSVVWMAVVGGVIFVEKVLF